MAKQKRSFGQKRENSKKEFFVGREVQVQKFQENIKFDPYDDEFKNIINVFGQGGVGKTTLLNKYLSICKSSDCCASFINTENIYEVTETMNFIANAFEQQGLSFKQFAKRYKVYLQEKGKLEAAPNKPKGTLGKLVKAGIKIGSKIGSETLPGGRLILDTSITDSAAEIASEWIDFVANNISNKDEIELVLHPLKVLTPIWIEDLYEASEKKKLALFFDTFEESNPELEKWLFELLKENYGAIPSILLVIGGRNALDPEKWSEFATFTYKIKLEPFAESEAKTYLEHRGINNPVLIEQLLAISGRLPVYLSLLADGDPTNPDEIFDPSEKIVERFLRHIDNPVLRDLALYACLPSQLNQDVVECLLPDQEKVNAKTHFEWLKARPFVEKRSNYWAYHAIVREIMRRHLKEISEKEWERQHLELLDSYEKKSARLEASGNRDAWFEDENWRIILFEKHFHLLCANYKKYLPGTIQDFVSLLFRQAPASTIPLVTTLNNVEKIMDVKHGVGEIFLKGIGSLMAKEEDGVLKMFSTINQLDFIVQDSEKSYVIFTQGVFEKNPDEAIACYQKALDIKPDNHLAFFKMGNAYLKTGDQDQAITCYQKATEIKPDYHSAFYNMGIAYSDKGDQGQAIASYQKALDIKPDKHEAFFNMGAAYSDKGDQDQAIASYQKALEIKPDYHEAFFNMGDAHSDKGDQDQAIACYQKALEIKPDYHEALHALGWLNLLLGKFEIAKSYLQRAWELSNFADPYAAMNLGHVSLLHERDREAAILLYQKSIALQEDSNSFFEGMESDFKDLQMEEQGITREDFDQLIHELKA